MEEVVADPRDSDASKSLVRRVPLLISEYAEQALRTAKFGQTPQDLEKLKFGLFGEIGGLLAAYKKTHRDHLRGPDAAIIGEEIGDALWYLFIVANRNQISAEQLGRESLLFLRDRFKESTQDLIDPPTFRQIDGIISLHGHELIPKSASLLREMASAVGQMLDRAEGPQKTMLDPDFLEALGGLLGYLALSAGSFELSIEEVAQLNLSKVKNRWPADNCQHIAFFDGREEEHEQLPREIDIEFIEREKPTAHVVQKVESIFIGDRLTDNRHEPDDYRFHDVFHIAYMVHLGWSPVMRALLKRKRKSNPKVDENEDGARAIVIEEGIATWIFNHAKERKLYAEVEPGRLEYSLLKQVHNMVEGYEVHACPLWQWESAILEGFRVFREMTAPSVRGGLVKANMCARTLLFEPRPRK